MSDFCLTPVIPSPKSGNGVIAGSHYSNAYCATTTPEGSEETIVLASNLAAVSNE
jgi:hypothetical protein